MPKKLIKKKSTAKIIEPKRSALDIFDIPLDLIDGSPENPQEMDDATFDELVEGVKAEGVDEPVHVVKQYDDDGQFTGRYMLTSGHHRCKAALVAGLEVVPAVIKKDMDDASRKIALVRRNQLRGTMNNKKFTALFKEVSPILGPEVAKRLMGFTKEAAFKKLFADVTKSLPEGARKQMEDAKETVRSVDDLSSVLNGIFRQEGSKVSNGYMVFSYGGKKHHYFQIDNNVSKMLSNLESRLRNGNETASEFFAKLLSGIGELKVERKAVDRAESEDNNEAPRRKIKKQRKRPAE